MTTYEELVSQSNAVLTPHLNTSCMSHGRGIQGNNTLPIGPINQCEIDRRERWKKQQIERLKSLSSNAVLCGGLGHEYSSKTN